MNFNVTNNALPVSTVKEKDYQNHTRQKTPQEKMNDAHLNNLQHGICNTSSLEFDRKIGLTPLTELLAKLNIHSKEANMLNNIVKADVRARIFKTDVLHFAQKIRQKADNIIGLYNQGNSMVDGIYQREIAYDLERDCEIMQETDGEGVLLRESIFQDGILTESIQYNDDGTTTELKLSNGEITSYKENLAISDDGEDMDKYCTFESGKISIYFEDYKEHNDGYSFVSKMVSFEKGNMTAYYETMESLPDGSSTIDLHLRYDEDERIKEYVEDIKDGYLFGKKYILVDGKWTEVPPPEDE